MERLMGNEYCCAMAPPTAPDFCLHVFIFYSRCTHTRPAVQPAPTPPPPPPPPPPIPPPIPPPARRLSRSPGWHRTEPPPREPPTTRRYAVYRLVYESAGHSLHKLFVQTGPLRGLYLHVTGTPEAGMRYSEMPGDDPERATPHILRAKTLVGTIAADNLDCFRHLCRQNPPPRNQFVAGHRLLPWLPLRHSQEWTQQSIQMGVAAGILHVGLGPSRQTT